MYLWPRLLHILRRDPNRAGVHENVRTRSPRPRSLHFRNRPWVPTPSPLLTSPGKPGPQLLAYIDQIHHFYQLNVPTKSSTVNAIRSGTCTKCWAQVVACWSSTLDLEVPGSSRPRSGAAPSTPFYQPGLAASWSETQTVLWTVPPIGTRERAQSKQSLILYFLLHRLAAHGIDFILSRIGRSRCSVIDPRRAFWLECRLGRLQLHEWSRLCWDYGHICMA